MEYTAIALIAALLVLAFLVYRRNRKRREGDCAPLAAVSTGSGPALTLARNRPGGAASRGVKTVEVSGACKSFGGTEVVSSLSFDVRSGEIFGLVGPNGAGKTTTMRMLVDIIRADSGEVSVFGMPAGEATKDRIGYLPEERGLHRKARISETLVYLARLKGMTPGAAREGTDVLLRDVGMFEHRDKKIEQLSRGMGQLVQFVSTIVHDPDLLILDEPFSGLDPVNRGMLKGLLLELCHRGKTIILSTHQMNEVEELCDRVLMIDRGRTVLYGELGEIRSRFRDNSIFLEYEGSVAGIPGVLSEKVRGKYRELFLDGELSPQEVLGQLLARGVTIHRFEVSTPSLNDIFVEVVKGRRHGQSANNSEA